MLQNTTVDDNKINSIFKIYMNEIKIGLIGLGGWGKNLYRNLENLNVLHKVYDKNLQIFKELKIEDDKISKNVNEIFTSKEIACVMIATPSVTHKNFIIRALESKKHVFVEKPLCLNINDAYEIQKKSEETKKIVFIGHLLQYHNAFIEMKKRIKNGEIGKVRVIKANRLNFGIVRNKESVVYDLSSHDVSMILSITKILPNKVSVNAVFSNSKYYADTINVILYFKNNLVAILNCDWISPYKEHRFSVYGSKGSLIFNDTCEWNKKLINNPSTLNKKDGINYISNRAIKIKKVEPLKKEIISLINCIKYSKKPYTDIKEALNVQIVLEMIDEEIKKKYNLK